MKNISMVLCVTGALVLSGQTQADPFKHQVTGLFAPDRVPDLRQVFEEIPEVKLLSIDYANAEVTLDYVPNKVAAGGKADQVLLRLDNLVKMASRSTFGIKALRTTSRDQLKLLEIPVGGCDCKACSLAAYEAIYKLDGVEQVTASFREGKVTAWIDPAKVDRAALEAALTKKGVTVIRILVERQKQ